MRTALTVRQDHEVACRCPRYDVVPHVQKMVLRSLVEGERNQRRLTAGVDGTVAVHVRVQHNDPHVRLHRSVEERKH